MNKVILMGRLTRDPEVRYSQENALWRLPDTLWLLTEEAAEAAEMTAHRQQIFYYMYVAFDRAGEFAEKYFHQGTKVVVTGRIQTGRATRTETVRRYILQK